MLNAKDFVKMDIEHPQQEVLRINSLIGRIDAQTVTLRRKLAMEFLEIVEDTREKIPIRASACNMLAGQRKKLGIIGSKAVMKRFRAVLVKEFLHAKRTGFLKHELILGKVRLEQYPLLLGLLSTMLRIDFPNTWEIAQSITNQIDDHGLEGIGPTPFGNHN